MSSNNQLTHEQVDTMEDCLRKAQTLVENAGAIASAVGGEANSAAWGRLTKLAENIGEEICGLYRLRPEGGVA
jgi:hypothetical protein